MRLEQAEEAEGADGVVRRVLPLLWCGEIVDACVREGGLWMRVCACARAHECVSERVNVCEQ